MVESSFWLGQAHTNLGSYVGYLLTILGSEKFRAGQFGIRHYCCIGLNPKEAHNEALAEAVPHFAVKESVVALGELATMSKRRKRISTCVCRSVPPRNSTYRS